MISETNVNASNASTPSTTSRKVAFRDEPGVRTRGKEVIARRVPFCSNLDDRHEQGELHGRGEKTVARVVQSRGYGDSKLSVRLVGPQRYGTLSYEHAKTLQSI